MEKSKHDINYFLMKFADIPEDRWCVGEFQNRDGNCCALGHLGVRGEQGFNIKDLPEAVDLFALAPDIIKVNDGDARNDTGDRIYGKIPKERVINYLKAIKAGRE